MKLLKALAIVYILWIVLNLGLYHYVQTNSPRQDARCLTIQDGRIINSKPCSRAIYQLNLFFTAEVVLLGLVALFITKTGSGKTGAQIPNWAATLSLVLGLLSIPALFLIGAGIVLAVLAILAAILAIQQAKTLAWPRSLSFNLRVGLGLLFSAISAVLLSAYLVLIMNHGGLRAIINTLRSLPLPR